MIAIRLVFTVLLLGLFVASSRGDIKDLKKTYRADANRYGFVLEFDESLRKDANGGPVAEADLDDCMKRLFSFLNKLERGFVKKAGITRVVFKDPLIDDLSGLEVAGLAGDGVIHLDRSFSGNVIYHELFHIFDKNHNSSKWVRTNPKGFVYKGSATRPAELNKKDIRRIAENEGKVGDHFVSSYAQSSEREDRAETFARMITEGSDFKARTKKSETLLEKMNLIIDVTDSTGLLGRGFWDTLLAENISEIKSLSESALAIRLIKDTKRSPVNPNAPLVVGGRKIVPLILALSQDKTELVQIFCAAGADPNVRDDKNRSALLLAVMNDDEVQVQALLQRKAIVGINELQAASRKYPEMRKLLQDAMGVR